MNIHKNGWQSRRIKILENIYKCSTFDLEWIFHFWLSGITRALRSSTSVNQSFSSKRFFGLAQLTSYSSLPLSFARYRRRDDEVAKKRSKLAKWTCMATKRKANVQRGRKKNKHSGRGIREGKRCWELRERERDGFCEYGRRREETQNVWRLMPMW